MGVHGHAAEHVGRGHGRHHAATARRHAGTPNRLRYRRDKGNLDLCREPAGRMRSSEWRAARRDHTESPYVARRESPTNLHPRFGGARSAQRTDYSLAPAEGEGAKEYDASCGAAVEVVALWNAIDKSVKAINGADGASCAPRRSLIARRHLISFMPG